MPNPKDTNIIEVVDNWEDTIPKAIAAFRRWPRWKVENTATAFSGNGRNDLLELWEKLQ